MSKVGMKKMRHDSYLMSHLYVTCCRSEDREEKGIKKRGRELS